MSDTATSSVVESTQQASSSQEQNSQTATQSSGQTEQGQSLGWRAALEKDLQTNERLSKFDKPSQLAKEFLSLEERSKGLVAIPTKDSTPEQQAAFRKALGVPESADKYEIPKEIDGIKLSQARIDNLRKVAFENGLTPQVVNTLIKSDLAAMSQEISEAIREASRSKEKAEAHYKSEWGGDYEKNLTIANRFYTSMFPSEVQGKLKQLGLANDPSFIGAIFEAAKKSGFMKSGLAEGAAQSEPARRGTIVDYKPL